jgi:hypothetical protein
MPATRVADAVLTLLTEEQWPADGCMAVLHDEPDIVLEIPPSAVEPPPAITVPAVTVGER